MKREKIEIKNSKVLLITKNYPPQIWGMEVYSQGLYNSLRRHNEVYLIANRRWKWALPFFCVKCAFQSIILAFKVDVIWSCDGSISFIGLFLAKLYKKRSIVTIHWLDVTWNFWLYQKVAPRIIDLHDQIVCVSESTRKECLRRWISEHKTQVIRNTLPEGYFPISDTFSVSGFLDSIWLPGSDSKLVLFSIGRWIPRKGFDWFLVEICPHLSTDYHYVLAWFWPMRKNYQKIIAENKIRNVTLIWKVTDKDIKSKLYQSCDCVIMPNQWISWDIEWHPIVSLEAEFYSKPLLAWSVEGLDESNLVKFCWNDKDKWMWEIERMYNKKKLWKIE